MATRTARPWPIAAVIAVTLVATSIIVIAFGADPVFAVAVPVASIWSPAEQAAAADAEASQAPDPAVVPAAGQVGNSVQLDDLVSIAVRNQLESIVGPSTSDRIGAPVSEPAPAGAAAPPPAIDADGRTLSGWLTPVNHYWLSARFGEPGPWSSGHHTGLDFVAPIGTPVRAPADGVVVAAAPGGAYGNLLKLRIAPGIELWFAHLRQFDVVVGARVHQGQSIGRVGMTGHTTGPHSHFEVRVRGTARDPEKYFWPDGNTAQRH